MTHCLGANDRRIIDVKFGNSTNDRTLHRQIGSHACGSAALSDRGAGGWVLGNRSFRKTTESKGEFGGGLYWMLTLAEKKTPDLDAIELAVRTPEKSPLPGAPTVRLLIRKVHQVYARR